MRAGTCASGSGKPFYFNTSADPIDGNENLLWFHEHELPKNGTARGNGANDGAILTSGANAVRSVSIVNAETRGERAAALRGRGGSCACLAAPRARVMSSLLLAAACLSQRCLAAAT